MSEMSKDILSNLLNRLETSVFSPSQAQRAAHIFRTIDTLPSHTMLLVFSGLAAMGGGI